MSVHFFSLAPASRTVIPVDPNKHKIEGTEYTIQREANCNGDGYKDRGCLHCGKRFGYSSEGLDRDPKKHVWLKDFAIDVSPSCTVEGSKSIHCEYGYKHDSYDKKDVTVIPMEPHYYDNVQYQFVTDDESKIYQHFKVCNRCKEQIIDNCTLNTQATTDPTETNAGYNTKVCSVCKHSRDIIYAISRNKDYTITQSGNSYVVTNKYHTVLKSGTLAEAIAALEAHRGLVRDENTDCTIHLAESENETSKDGFFNIIDGAIALTNGNYTITGKLKGQVGSVEKGLITVKSIGNVSWENFAHVTLKDMTIEADCFEGVAGGAVYIEKGKLSVYNSTITSDSRHNNITSGAITMISEGVLNIYDGSIIKNTFVDDNLGDSFIPATFAIGMSETSNSNFEVNIWGEKIESNQRFSIAGHNVKFTMCGGEVKNVNGTAVFIKGNSLLNITGGNISGGSGGVYVNNGNAAKHTVCDCTIIAGLEAISVSGKGTLDISQSSGKTTLLQSSGSSVTAGATVSGTVSINGEASLNMTGGKIQNTDGVALYIRSQAMAYNIGYSQENNTTPQIINNSNTFSTIYLFDYDGTQTSAGALKIHGATIKNNNAEKGYAIEAANTKYNIEIISDVGKITTIESTPGTYGVIYMKTSKSCTLKVDSATVINKLGTGGYDIYSNSSNVKIHALARNIGGQYTAV